LSERSFLPRSLRWRLQLWLAFLLVCVLAGFGFTVYQLQRVNRLNQIDRELQTRISALANAYRELFRPPGPPPRERRPPPDDDGRGRPPGPPPDRPPHRRPPPGMDAPQDLPLPAETLALFGDLPGDYYFVVWYRDGSVLKRSAAAPDLTRPDISERDTIPNFRTREEFREAIHCSGMGDCVLAGRSV
jgi:hypothetical protein